MIILVCSNVWIDDATGDRMQIQFYKKSCKVRCMGYCRIISSIPSKTQKGSIYSMHNLNELWKKLYIVESTISTKTHRYLLEPYLVLGCVWLRSRLMENNVSQLSSVSLTGWLFTDFSENVWNVIYKICKFIHE